MAIWFLTTDVIAATQVRSGAREEDENKKYAAIVIDAATGEILMSDSPDKQVHPASLTKMMTLLLAFDALSERRVRPNDYIRISNFAASMVPSKIGIKPGGRIRFDDALRAISVKSANDISVAMAEALAGSESRFAKKMNLRAREIGMTHTQFVNASGLHHAFQLTTARDMAILGRYILVTYPKYYRYFGLRSFSYAGRTHPNHNKLMARYPGMDGMKTGYISQSGFNLVASAKRGNRRLIGVVFGGRTGRSRDDHMEKILDAAFAKPPKLIKPKLDVAQLPTLSPPLAALPPTGLQLGQEDRTDMMSIPVPPQNPRLQMGIINGVAVPDRKPDGTVKERDRSDLSYPSDLPFPPRTPQSLGQIQVPATSDNLLPSVSGSVQKNQYSVQIGAYQSREATDRALYNAVQKLPADLADAVPVVAPLKSVESGWLFRARLGNLSAEDANRICRLLSGCLVLAPEQ